MLKKEVYKIINNNFQHLNELQKKDKIYSYYKVAVSIIYQRFRKSPHKLVFSEHYFSESPCNLYYLKDNFSDFWHDNLKMRRVAGALLINRNNQVLVVVTIEGCVNIPMGKEDYDDDENLKTTSLRELGEETKYWWPLQEVSNFNLFFRCPIHTVKSNNRPVTKYAKIFVHNNFPHAINHDHFVPNEIKISFLEKSKQFFRQISSI